MPNWLQLVEFQAYSCLKVVLIFDDPSELALKEETAFLGHMYRPPLTTVLLGSERNMHLICCHGKRGRPQHEVIEQRGC